MKTKLRSITVHQLEFKYLISEKFVKDNDGYWLTRLRVFRKDFKNTPFEVTFNSIDGYAVGNVLTSGIIINEALFNLHKPSIIRKIIEAGISLQWNWENSKLEISNGLKLLADIGYPIASLKPNN